MKASAAFDIEAQTAVEERFGLETLEYREQDATAIMRLSLAGMLNPVNDVPSIAPLALLVDNAGTKAAYARRRGGWPVTSDLNIQLFADVQPILEINSDEHVVAHACVVNATTTNALAACTLSVAAETIGTATVRSVYIPGDVTATHRPAETLVGTSEPSLADLMAVEPAHNGRSPGFLRQLPDPMVFNAIANVHGGVAATGLELVAAAAIWDATGSGEFRTGSLQVNFLRPFVAGADSRYIGTALHAGSSVAVAEAEAIGANGKVAVTARLTAYRPT